MSMAMGEYGYGSNWPSWTWRHRDLLPPIVPPGHVLVWLRLRAGDYDIDYPVAFPRVPCVGENITGPDDFGTVKVVEIDWRFEGGFASAPMPFVKAMRQ